MNDAFLLTVTTTEPAPDARGRAVARTGDCRVAAGDAREALGAAVLAFARARERELCGEDLVTGVRAGDVVTKGAAALRELDVPAVCLAARARAARVAYHARRPRALRLAASR